MPFGLYGETIRADLATATLLPDNRLFPKRPERP
jgi:hypothetical protein